MEELMKMEMELNQNRRWNGPRMLNTVKNRLRMRFADKSAKKKFVRKICPQITWFLFSFGRRSLREL